MDNINLEQKIHQEQFQARREKFFSKMNTDEIAVIVSGTQKVRTNDVHYKFRQNNNFWYLTGFPECNAIVVFIKQNKKNKYWLFCQEIDELHSIWDGEVIGTNRAKKIYKPDRVFPILEFWYGYKKLLNPTEAPNMIDENDKKEIFSASPRGWDILDEHWLDNDSLGLKRVEDVNEIIHSLRLIKDKLEIAMIQKAVDLSVKAHKKAMKFTCREICNSSDIYEYQVEATITHKFNSNNCDHAYSPIVAGGGNANTLHYIANNSKLIDGDLILIDAGAEYENYASDITRTFPVNGKFTLEQKNIYNLVLKMQETGLEMIKPGAIWQEIQDKIIKELVNGLIKLKILSGKVEEIIENKEYRKFYPHSFGHWLGLDVHDVGGYFSTSNKPIALVEGMVLTVEPGIYISENIAGVDKKWHNIAVRIEDDVVVTRDGCDVLSKKLPKSVSEIERWCDNNL
ncbi:MAG: aminopeptidase P N-terminal domain-containing protein [Legionellales bacterium]|nr:aminopeptidase P N-terminal domain-containing protein [Legionellales bacterium]